MQDAATGDIDPNAVDAETTEDSAEDAVEAPAVAARTLPEPILRGLAIARRVPFTIGYLAITLVLGIALGTLWAPVTDKAWYADIAFGLPAFEAGRWLTIVLGAFFATSPLIYLVSLPAFALLVGGSEWRLGTARTAALTIGFHALTVLLSAAILAVARNLAWPWAQAAATQVDVGFSAGMVAVAIVASATVRPPWGRRIRLALVGFVLFSLAMIGELPDVVHLVGVLIAVPFAARLAGARAIRRNPPASYAEKRLIVTIGALAVAAAQIVVHVIPERPTPFGPAAHTPWTATLIIIALVVTALLAQGLRRGRRWAWWIAVVVALVPVVLAAMLGVALVASPDAASEVSETIGIAQLLASATMYLVLLVVLLWARDAYQPAGPTPKLSASTETPDVARELLRTYGGSSISWMTTWPRMRHMVSADGQSFIGFREHLGVAIALGDPSGPTDSAAATIEDFIARCGVSDAIPFLFSCTNATVAIAKRLGWQTVQIAEDNLIDLPDLAFTGKRWQNVRTALNKAPKEGVSFRLSILADEPPEILDQVRAVSAEWLGDKELPEMGFTLGGVPEALDRDVRVGLAVGADGRLHGVTSWLPAYGGDGHVEGWTLDVMRRIEFEGNFRPTMEFLIASSALAFKEQGASYVSLSGAPLARSTAPENEGALEHLLDTIGALMEPLYGFRSLHAFKAKFQPRLAPMHMAFRDEADLPRIGLAIARAFLPDAGVGDVVGIAKSMAPKPAATEPEAGAEGGAEAR